jgi:prepilin-type N-terminal cleavage/methylation domain-containing protein
MRGFTLIELLVVLVVLGLLTGGAVMGAGSAPARLSDTPGWHLLRARARVARLGMPDTVTDSDGTRLLLLPDGRVLTDRADRDGRPDDTPR